MITNLITPGTTAFAALCLAGYLLLANALAYTAFAVDKSRAIRAERRIPERSLLILATLGGWIGAKLAQHRLRHKTRKQPFGILLNLSVLVIPGLIATAILLQSDLTWDKLTTQAGTTAQGLFASSDSATLPRRFGPGSAAP
ncbi:DUF1294 domain-containing protein [Cypionkella sp.]|uniref:DUF1294 domain-containing protein n=1 Tax=Cypionkella sp. TaxID=2811411 RepID=UPI002ABA9D5A|nr:DUF1294 domain-containing protein [Cypionkella sp.]MDZ4391700.1 DUF1294 domain-containing protein [Cypionkella sp.]